jgi:hypothetical protein
LSEIGDKIMQAESEYSLFYFKLLTLKVCLSGHAASEHWTRRSEGAALEVLSPWTASSQVCYVTPLDTLPSEYMDSNISLYNGVLFVRPSVIFLFSLYRFLLRF